MTHGRGEADMSVTALDALSDQQPRRRGLVPQGRRIYESSSLRDPARTRVLCDLELVIPALNEEQRIGTTLAAIVSFLSQQSWRSSVTVVDNGSADRTSEVVDTLMSDRVAVRLIGCARRGKGAAIRRAVACASARWVGFCDADLATPVEAIGAVVPLLEAGHEIVVGARRCNGAAYAIAQSPIRRAGSYAFRRATSHYVPTVRDTQCGFKFFQASIAKDLFMRAKIDGFAFDVEVLGLATKDGTPIVEVPVTWSDVGGSTFQPLRDGIRLLSELRMLHAGLADAEPVRG